MRVFKKLTESVIREDDILACINGDIFAILCPYMPNEKAKVFVSDMKKKLSSVAEEILVSNGGGQIKSYSSVVTYQGGFIKEGGLLEKGILALEDSNTSLSAEV
jgi:GGDEF domain-containing protein